MNALTLSMKDGQYVAKGSGDSKPLSNCTLRLLRPIMAGDRTGYIGRATHTSGHTKQVFYALFEVKSFRKNKCVEQVRILKAKLKKLSDEPKGRCQCKYFFLYLFHREFFCHLSSFRNINGFEKDLNYGVGGLRRYSVNVNCPTLENLLTKLSDKIQVPEDDRDVKRAVSVIGRNINGRGQAIWCLNERLSLDGEGNIVNCEDYGLEWISHLTEGDGKNIAKRELACMGEGPLTTGYFNIVSNFLADTLEEVCANDTRTRVTVNEVFDNDTSLFYGSEAGEGKLVSAKKNRSNFVSQFYVASMGVVMANFCEVCLYHI